MTPQQMMNFMQYGIGPFSMPKMAARIEKSMPNASPLEKFYALKAGMKLMNPSGQNQFSQMMQLMQLQQRQQQHEDTLRQQERMEGHRQERETLMEDRYLRGSQYMQQQQGAAQSAQKNLTNNELRTNKINEQIDALKPIAAKVGITGNVNLDTWLQEARTKLGWQDKDYTKYKTMLEILKSEMAGISQQTLNALTVSARADADKLVHGIMTPTMLQSIKEALKIDTDITKKSAQKLIDKANDNMDYYMRSRGQRPPAQPDEETTSAPAARPRADDGKGNVVEWDGKSWVPVPK
jgi:hypothetical protein